MDIYSKLYSTTYQGDVKVNNLDYSQLRLHKKVELNSTGDVTRIKWYTDVDATTRPLVFNEDNLVIDRQCAYVRDATGVMLQENLIIDYYRRHKDVTSKIHTETYSVYHEVEEGIAKNEKAAKRLLSKAKKTAMGLIGLANGKELLVDINGAFEFYINGNRQPLLDSIANSTRAYMTQEVKDTLINLLNVTY